MQLKNIKAEVRQLLQDPDYDGDIIKTAANWFVFELANNNKLRMFEESDTMNASAGETTAEFPTDMLAWISIYTTAPRTYSVIDDYVEYPDFMGSYAGFATSASAQLGHWTQYGTGMRFSAPLNVDHDFQIDYIREPVPMEADSDECEIPARYAELVARGTKARILEIEEDYDIAQAERDIMDPLMTAFIRNESRGGGKTRPTVIRTNRRGARRGGIPRLGD